MTDVNVADVAFGAGIRLLKAALQHPPFTGTVTAKQGPEFNRLIISLTPGPARDVVEHRVQLAVNGSFAHVQIVGFAFAGKNRDETAIVMFTLGTPTMAQVVLARQALQDTDARVRIFYPLRTVQP